jgi:hypothetical protein
MSTTVIELVVGTVLAFAFLLWTRAQPDAGAAYTPDWYPWGCVAFDLVVGGAVFVAGVQAQRSA